MGSSYSVKQVRLDMRFRARTPEAVVESGRWDKQLWELDRDEEVRGRSGLGGL